MDYVSYGKKNPANFLPSNYIGAKTVDGFINQCKNSYNIGLQYGAKGVAYSFGQATTVVAETGVSAYGPTTVSNASTSIKNYFNKFSTSASKSNPLANIKYTQKVLDQAAKNDYHGFPECADAFGADGIVTNITGGDGIVRTKVEIPGSYKNKDGVFQYIIEPDGVTCNHRLFVPD